MDGDPRALANWALAFERKLGRLAEQADGARLQQASPLWRGILALPDGTARRRIYARVFGQEVAALPALLRFSDRSARVALLDRPTLERHLCVLALACRPGVLRSCVQRDARARLRQFLGSAFDPLMSFSHLGRSCSEAVAQWPAARWAGVGYFDWTSLLKPEDAGLRRVVRMSLPPGLPTLRRLCRTVPAEIPPQRAVAMLLEHRVEWSC